MCDTARVADLVEDILELNLTHLSNRGLKRNYLFRVNGLRRYRHCKLIQDLNYILDLKMYEDNEFKLLNEAVILT